MLSCWQPERCYKRCNQRPGNGSGFLKALIKRPRSPQDPKESTGNGDNAHCRCANQRNVQDDVRQLSSGHRLAEQPLPLTSSSHWPHLHRHEPPRDGTGAQRQSLHRSPLHRIRQMPRAQRSRTRDGPASAWKSRQPLAPPHREGMRFAQSDGMLSMPPAAA